MHPHWATDMIISDLVPICVACEQYRVYLDPFSAILKTETMETLFSVEKLPGPAGFLTVNSRHPEVTLFGADLRGCPGTRAEAADLCPAVFLATALPGFCVC